MSRPLVASKDTAKIAAQFHADVFRTFGPYCWLHRVRDPQSKVRATDCAHVIKRSRMGAALAYASVRLARPICRPCHSLQELGLDPLYAFPLADRIDAALAHNEIAKSALPVPTD